MRKADTFTFDSVSPNNVIWQFGHRSAAYLSQLRDGYQLESLIEGLPDDLGKLQAILHWCHTRWQPDSAAMEATRIDPISILQAATLGQRFRCVEYALVAEGVFNALGYATRVLTLMTKDVETRSIGAGHVVAEVFLPDRQRWVFVDPQCDVIPLLDGQPLNAVELVMALHCEHRITLLKAVGFHCSDERLQKAADGYFSWLLPYLYYFTAAIETYTAPRSSRQLRLAPQGTKNPLIFQREYAMPLATLTHSVADFYPKDIQRQD